MGIELYYRPARAHICKPFKESRIDSQPGGPVPYLLYRLTRLHRLAESIPRNQFLESIPGLIKHLQIRAQATLANGIGSLESIPRLIFSYSLGPELHLDVFRLLVACAAAGHV